MPGRRGGHLGRGSYGGAIRLGGVFGVSGIPAYLFIANATTAVVVIGINVVNIGGALLAFVVIEVIGEYLLFPLFGVDIPITNRARYTFL